jgi:hypothetical protein
MRRIWMSGIWILAATLAMGPSGCGKNLQAPTAATPAGITAPPPGAGVVWHQALTQANAPTSSQFSERGFFSTVTFNGLLWVIGGNDGSNYLNEVWNSPDAVHWTKVLSETASPTSSQFTERNSQTALVYNPSTGSGADGDLWIMGGYGGSLLNDVWKSADGVNWQKVLSDTASPPSTQFSEREEHCSVVFNGAMWVIGGLGGGYLNDVWKSTDGVNWTNVLVNNASPASNQFPQRENPSAVVYDGAMWVMGGYGGGSNALNDVWNSTDGVSWAQVLPNNVSPAAGQFPQRSLESLVVYNGAMWVIAGDGDSNALNDVWSSTDGSHWTQELLQAPFAIRYSSGLASFNGSLWLFGGVGAGTYYNDAWYSN